jgi:hypothetical protein
LILYGLIMVGMMEVGYQTAISGSTRRFLAASSLALSFALVVALIAALDNTQGAILAPQGPMIELQATMSQSAGDRR